MCISMYKKQQLTPSFLIAHDIWKSAQAPKCLINIVKGLKTKYGAHCNQGEEA